MLDKSVLMNPLVQRFIVKAARRHLPTTEAISRIRKHPGLIPVASVHTDGSQLIWLDVGDSRLSEFRFMESLARMSTESPARDAFATDVSILACDDILTDSVLPTGIMFHVARCGSTLLANALSRSPLNLVMKEPSLFRGASVWPAFTDDWSRPAELTDKNVRMLRNLVLAMGRRRADYQDYFLKMTSWNNAFIDLFAEAFPDVPMLYLYRDPTEVLVSMMKATGPYLRFKHSNQGAFVTQCPQPDVCQMSELDYYVNMEVEYLSAALNSSADNLNCLNYCHLNRENFAAILRQAFRYEPGADQLDLMEKQFDFYSKDNLAVRFVLDSAEKQKAATPEIRQAVRKSLAGLYAQLEAADNNLMIADAPVLASA